MIMLRTIRYLASAVALVFAGSSTSAISAEVQVDQKDLQFVPGAVTINAGDSVRFTDTDRIAHNVTIENADGTSEDKGMSEYNQHIVVKFSNPGLYHARCRIHPQMQMTITVRP
jgi:plastocyanin